MGMRPRLPVCSRRAHTSAPPVPARGAQVPAPLALWVLSCAPGGAGSLFAIQMSHLLRRPSPSSLANFFSQKDTTGSRRAAKKRSPRANGGGAPRSDNRRNECLHDLLPDRYLCLGLLLSPPAPRPVRPVYFVLSAPRPPCRLSLSLFWLCDRKETEEDGESKIMNRVLMAELSATTYALLVLLVPLVQADEQPLTLFRLDATVTCNVKKAQFRYRIVVEELDVFGMNDVICQFGVYHSKDFYRNSHSMNGTQSGDGFSFICDGFYEVATFIYHDCTSDGGLRRIRDPWHDNIPITAKLVKREVDINLTDAGDRVATFFGDK